MGILYLRRKFQWYDVSVSLTGDSNDTTLTTKSCNDGKVHRRFGSMLPFHGAR